MKPVVFSCVPSRSDMHVNAAYSHFILPTKGDVSIIPSVSTSSLLAHGFNIHWANALNFDAQYFLMHHDDIEIQTPFYVDVMIEELNRVGAAVLSVVQPIKDGKQETTSIALETPAGPWLPRRMTFKEIAEQPETFTLPHILINTGLMLVDLRRPEFREMCGEELYFKFEIGDRVIKNKDGQFVSQVRPEDWNFSRKCHAKKLPLYATTKIKCLHYGVHGFSNQPERKPEPKVNEPCLA